MRLDESDFRKPRSRGVDHRAVTLPEGEAMQGSAVCHYCRTFNKHIPLTGYRDTDGAGGWNWKVTPDSLCPQCGANLRWMHQPAPQLIRGSASTLTKPVQATLEQRRLRRRSMGQTAG